MQRSAIVRRAVLVLLIGVLAGCSAPAATAVLPTVTAASPHVDSHTYPPHRDTSPG